MLIRIAGIILFVLPSFNASRQQSVHPPDGSGTNRSLLQPESFYVANYQQNVWTIIDLQPASVVDTKVRFIRAYLACDTYHVQETDYIFENVSVAELAGKAALCEPDKSVSRLVNLFKDKKLEASWPDDRVGTFAQCGTTRVVHRLPSRNDLRYAELQNKAENVTALWDLESQILKRYTKVTEWEPFKYPIDEETRLRNQHLTEHAAIQIRNGDFDRILPEGWSSEGPLLLADLIPDPERATEPEEDHGVVENIDHLGLEKNEPIPYPQMGRIAHIQGDVRVAIRIDAASGAVISATALSGHPLLQKSATDSISKWSFLPPYFGPNPLEVIVHYTVRCPPRIETQTNSASKKIKKRPRKKPTPGGRRN